MVIYLFSTKGAKEAREPGVKTPVSKLKPVSIG
jgi:hypothetical protein